MFGLRITTHNGRVYWYLPYSREALKHNIWGMIRGTNSIGEVTEIAWGKIKDYWTPRWVPSRSIQ